MSELSSKELVSRIDDVLHRWGQKPLQFSRLTISAANMADLLGDVREHLVAQRTAHEPLVVPAAHREGSEPLSRLIGDIDYCLAQIDPAHRVHATLTRVGVSLRNMNTRTVPPPEASHDVMVLRGALCELRIRLHCAGRRPEECYEMSIIDDALQATRHALTKGASNG